MRFARFQEGSGRRLSTAQPERRADSLGHVAIIWSLSFFQSIDGSRSDFGFFSQLSL